MDPHDDPALLPQAEEEEGGPVKPFLDHLEDLRWVLIKCVSALALGLVACLGGAPYIITFLTWPVYIAQVPVEVQWLDPLGGFLAAMKIALYGGLVFGLPFILYFIAEFVMPALKAHEKKYFSLAFTVGGGLFLLGAMMCYFWVLPIALKGTVAFNQWLGVPTLVWRGESYFQFVIMFMVGMGLSFEIPVVLLTLVKVGVLPHEWLVKGRKYFFVINLILCSFITPDFISTIFMIIPVTIEMEVCIQISKYWERQKKMAEASAAAAGTNQMLPPD
ncbi:MAG: twin-arginine translocase subunit TatC [Verrucomicrobiota bacterium]